jgi:hypothetical protein
MEVLEYRFKRGDSEFGLEIENVRDYLEYSEFLSLELYYYGNYDKSGVAKTFTEDAVASTDYEKELLLNEAGYGDLDGAFEALTGQWTNNRGYYLYFDGRSHRVPIQFLDTTSGEDIKGWGEYSLMDGNTTKIELSVYTKGATYKNVEFLSNLKYVELGVKGDNTIYINNEPWTFVSLNPLYEIVGG